MRANGTSTGTTDYPFCGFWDHFIGTSEFENPKAVSHPFSAEVNRMPDEADHECGQGAVMRVFVLNFYPGQNQS